MKVAIALFDGFDDLDAIGPFEVFQHAQTFGADVDVGLYTLEPQDVVTSSHGLRIRPDGVLDDANGSEPDLVVVPGGGWSARAEEGAWGEAERGVLPDLLKRLHDTGTTVASVCTGGMLLARAGLTEGRPAVTHHDALEDLRKSGAEVVDSE